MAIMVFHFNEGNQIVYQHKLPNVLREILGILEPIFPDSIGVEVGLGLMSFWE